MTEKEQLKKLAKKYFAWAYKAFPVWATSKGIHQYDDSYSDLSKKGIGQQLKTIKKFQKKLAEIDPEKLDVYSQSEYEMLKGSFAWEILEYEKVRFFEKNPGFYLDEIVWGLFFLLTREFAPPEERAKNLLARLKKVPQVLKQGKRNIKVPPKVYTEVAIQASEGALMLFRQNIPEFAQKAPILEKQILTANKKAIKAVEDYLKFLKKLLPRSQGEYALGQELFEKKLNLAQQLEYSAQELLDLGWQVFRQTEKEMEAVSQEIEAGKPWPEIVKKLRKEVPKIEKLLKTYEKEVVNLKKFLAKKQVVPLPEGENLKVMDTPHSERATTPYAAYLSPAPFEDDQTGQF
jgi:uncharacterized protein (DUF885 family)